MNPAAAAPASTEGLEPPAPDAGGLFSRYSAQIFAYCLHSLGSRSDAEDALQTTFLHAHRALQRGVVPECESAWLTAIAKNACRSQRRTQARRAPVSDGLDIAVFPARDDTDRQGTVADLKEALASIPERQRKALLLREWQGLQPSEIAPRVGASTSETYALLTRARRSVASALTTAARRPVLGLDFGSLVLQLRSLVAGTPATVGAAAVAVAGLGIAGVTVEHAVGDHHSAKPAQVVVAHAPRQAAPVHRVAASSTRPHPRFVHRGPRPLAAAVPRATAHPQSRGGGEVRTATEVPRETSHGAQSGVGRPAASTTAPTSSSPNASAPAKASAPAPSLPPAPAVTVPDPSLPLPVDLPPPVSTVVSTATGLLPGQDAPSTTSDPPPSPLPALPPPVGNLLP